MKRYFPFAFFKYFQRTCSIYVKLISYFLLLIILCSCTEGPRKRYKFQPESMHWLQFRGPNASGIAPENADPPIHFSADTNLLWKTEILPGWSSPCIVNDRIFLTGFDKEDSLFYTFCINREDGSLIWADSVKPYILYDLHSINTYVNPTIASDGERIFSQFPCHGLLAYDLDGTKIWEHLHPVYLHSMIGGFSPVVRDSLLIFSNYLGYANARVQVHHCRTGDSIRVMQNSLYPISNATPVFYNDLLIMHKVQQLVGYDMKSGNIEWSLNVGTQSSSSPVLYNDLVIVGTWVNFGERNQRGLTYYSFEELLGFYDQDNNSTLEQAEIPDSIVVYTRPEAYDIEGTSARINEDRRFQQFDENKDGSIDKKEWDSYSDITYTDHGMLALPVSGKGELSDSLIRWKITKDTPEVPSPLIVGENVFFIKNGGIITVINVESGDVVKKGRIGAPGAYLSSPMLADMRIYTCSYNGMVSVLSADDFSVLASNKLKEKIGASPVAVDDVLYVRTDKHLYAFREI